MQLVITSVSNLPVTSTSVSRATDVGSTPCRLASTAPVLSVRIRHPDSTPAAMVPVNVVVPPTPAGPDPAVPLAGAAELTADVADDDTADVPPALLAVADGVVADGVVVGDDAQPLRPAANPATASVTIRCRAPDSVGQRRADRISASNGARRLRRG